MQKLYLLFRILRVFDMLGLHNLKGGISNNIQWVAVLGACHNVRKFMYSRTNVGGSNGNPSVCVCVNIYTYTYIKVKDTPWNAYSHTEVRWRHSSNPNRSRHWQVDGQQSALADLSPGNDNTHCAGGWVGLGVGLDGTEITPPLLAGIIPGTIQSVESLYWLRYTGRRIYTHYKW
jgi:hypothetical protein